MRLRRVILGTAIAVATLLLLVAGVVYWALNSEAASRRALRFVLGKSPAGLEIAAVRGPLRGPLFLFGIRYRSGGLSAEIDSAMVDVRPSDLLSGRLVFDQVRVSGMRVVLPDSAPPDTAGTAKGRRERPEPPIPVIVSAGSITGFELDAPRDLLILRSGTVDLSGSLEDYRFRLSAVAMLPQVDTTMLELSGTGNQEAVRFDSTTTVRVAGSRVAAGGTVKWWPMVEWDLAVGVESLRPSRWMRDPALLPGSLNLEANTTGRIDSAGPVGEITIDSMSGVLRNQPVSGRAQVRFAGVTIEQAQVNVRWGTAVIKAEGDVGKVFNIQYDVAVADLRTLHPAARGSMDLAGNVSGTVETPRVEAEVDGRGIEYAGSDIERLTGKVDINLAAGGRTTAELRADSVKVATRPFDQVRIDLRGVTGRHQLKVLATAPADTMRIGVAGGLRGRIWRGQVEEFSLLTADEDWRLAQPAALTLSQRSSRLEPMCIAGDSAGRGCAEMTWSGARNWQVLANLEAVQLERLPMLLPLGLRADQLRGVLSAGMEARNTRDGLVATLEAQVQDSLVERATLRGRLTMPGYWLGRPLRRQPMLVNVQGRMDSLSILAAAFPAVDSLSGSATLELNGSGTVPAPRIESTLRIDSVVARLRHRRRITGSVELATNLTVQQNRAFQGEIRLVPIGLQLEYQPARRLVERLTVDSGGVSVVAGADGVRGALGLTIRNAAGDSLVGLSGALRLPRFTRWGQPLASQPVSLELAADLADLSAVQPLAMTMDSLGGTVGLTLNAEGTVGMPSLKGALRIENGMIRMTPTTLVRGGVNGDLDVTIAQDSSVRGMLRIVPHSVKFEYPRGDTVGEVYLRETALEIRAGSDGVRGTFDMTLAADGDSTLGNLRGRGSLPRYTRFGRSLAPEPIEATLEGQIDDFAFLPAFLSFVDSASGQMIVDARLTGTLRDSRLVGGAELRDVSARLPGLGIILDDLDFSARGDREGSITVDGRMRSGGGELSLKGSTPVRPDRNTPGRFQLRGTNFLASNNAEAEAVISPQLDVTLIEDTISVRGQIDVPLARIELTELPQAAIKPSDDVILLDSTRNARRGRPIRAEVRVALGDSVSFRGFNFDAELGGSLLLIETPQRPAQATGTLVIEEGHYNAYGQALSITDGAIRFAGPLDNPSLNIRASRLAADSMNVGIAMRGTLKEPDVRLYSDEPMAQAQILSYLVTGGPVGGAGSAGNLINKALSALGLSGGSQILGAVGEDLGLEHMRLETSGDLQDAALVLGRYLSPNVYISYGIGLFDPVSTLRLRYVLSSKFSVQAEAGGRSTGGDALIRIRK